MGKRRKAQDSQKQQDEEEELELNEEGRVVGVEGLMDYSFSSYTSVFSAESSQIQALASDCEFAFVEGGMSFWLGAKEKPRCQFERMAKEIFEHHTKSAKFQGQRSGVEWWVQIRRGGLGDKQTDIGMHWDKDEDLVDQQGINIHPQISTVTYLSDHGAPTLVLQRTNTTIYEDTPEVCYGPIGEGLPGSYSQTTLPKSQPPKPKPHLSKPQICTSGVLTHKTQL